LDLANAWGGPRDSFSFLFLSPGPNRSSQNCFAALDFYLDLARVNLGVSNQSFLYPLF
jgi:hypothetical protein